MKSHTIEVRSMKTLEHIHKYDVNFITKLTNSHNHAKLLPISRAISKSGDGWIYLIVGILSILFPDQDNLIFITLLCAFVIERVLYYLLKNTLKRKRPFNIINIKNHVVPSDSFSFPSGHTSSAFLFATLMSHFYPLLTIPFILWATGIGFSRIILGVHFLTDILIGMIIGICVAQLTLTYM